MQFKGWFYDQFAAANHVAGHALVAGSKLFRGARIYPEKDGYCAECSIQIEKQKKEHQYQIAVSGFVAEVHATTGVNLEVEQWVEVGDQILMNSESPKDSFLVKVPVAGGKPIALNFSKDEFRWLRGKKVDRILLGYALVLDGGNLSDLKQYLRSLAYILQQTGELTPETLEAQFVVEEEFEEEVLELDAD
jgi:hypothetical protein